MTRFYALFALCVGSIFVGLGLGGCEFELYQQEKHLSETDTIHVGSAWPLKARRSMLFEQGVNLAEEQINADTSLLTRPIKVEFRDDQQSINQARVVATRFAEDPRVQTVIGHLQSYTTLSAAPIYDRAGMLHLVPAATDPDLTQRQYPHIFQMIPDNRAIGRHMATLAVQRGFRRILIGYTSNEYGQELANAFEKEGSAEGLTIVHRESYNATGRQRTSTLRSLAASWKKYKFDAVFIAGVVPSAALLVSQLRNVGIKVPVLGSDAMAIPPLLRIGGEAVEDTYVPTHFHTRASDSSAQRFAREFQARYGGPPDISAAAGYDALYIAARAMAATGSTDPDSLARYLKNMPPWKGATGRIGFTDSGSLMTSPLTSLVVEDGEFRPLQSGSQVAPNKLSP